MNSAAFDSSHGLSFAVHDGDRVVVDAHEPSHGRGTEMDFVLWVRACLRDAGISLPTIARWTVGTGPGSFTGIRLGVGFVKGVCLQTCAGYRGVPSSVALAAEAAEELSVGDKVAVLNDARRGEIIVSPYQKQSNGGVQGLNEPFIVHARELGDACRDCAILVTPQAEQVGPLLPPALQSRLLSKDHVPAACLLDAPGYTWPSTPAEQETSCEPIYVRPPVFVKPRMPQPPDFL